MEEKATGCQHGSHVACPRTSEALSRFASVVRDTKASTPALFKEDKPLISFDDPIPPPAQAEVSTPSAENSKGAINTLLLTELGEKLIQRNGVMFIRHDVDIHVDTLTGISLRYHISSDQLKQANKLRSDEELWTRTHILIPYKGQKFEEPNEEERLRRLQQLQQRYIRRFVKLHRCSQEEATLYLEQNQFDFEEASVEYEDDLRWERENSHSFKKSTIVK